MSLLGIDAGTTGCKASVFTQDGTVLASAYQEYDVQRPQPGWEELDAQDIWEKIKVTVRQVVSSSGSDPVTALAVSSLGEATVPVTADRRILGSSLLMGDRRGEEYLERLAAALPPERLYRINGNTLGNHYGLTKLLWIKEHYQGRHDQTHKYLLWSSFVAFMLGADPVVDYSLANRTLLFDVDRKDWSDEILDIAGLDREKLPGVAPSGTVIGTVSGAVADDLGLARGVGIVTGAHDQCANAVGCGVTDEGSAMYGMGTFICIVPPFRERKPGALMMARGLNTEHHAVPGLYVSFIYNQGGILVKWFRDTFAAMDREHAAASGEDVYDRLTAEMPAGPSSVMVLPHFTGTGPPEFISDTSGVITGVNLATSRGDILKGIIEGATFYLRECVDSLPGAGIEVSGFRAVGGGSKSDAWLQISADLMGKPFVRTAVAEAGTMGAAIMAGTGSGVFASMQDGVDAMVRLERAFEPGPAKQGLYDQRFEKYTRLGPLMRDYLRDLG